MTQDTIFPLIVDCVCAVVPEIQKDSVVPGASLRDLGANSIDRAEILSQVVERLGLRVSMVRVGSPETVGEIAALLAAAGSQTQAGAR